MCLPGKWEETSSAKTLLGNLGIGALAKTSPLGAVVCGTVCMCIKHHADSQYDIQSLLAKARNCAK